MCVAEGLLTYENRNTSLISQSLLKPKDLENIKDYTHDTVPGCTSFSFFIYRSKESNRMTCVKEFHLITYIKYEYDSWNFFFFTLFENVGIVKNKER